MILFPDTLDETPLFAWGEWQIPRPIQIGPLVIVETEESILVPTHKFQRENCGDWVPSRTGLLVPYTEYSPSGIANMLTSIEAEALFNISRLADLVDRHMSEWRFEYEYRPVITPEIMRRDNWDKYALWYQSAAELRREYNQWREDRGMAETPEMSARFYHWQELLLVSVGGAFVRDAAYIMD